MDARPQADRTDVDRSPAAKAARRRRAAARSTGRHGGRRLCACHAPTRAAIAGCELCDGHGREIPAAVARLDRSLRAYGVTITGATSTSSGGPGNLPA